MAGEWPEYISWLKRQACAAEPHRDCQGPIEAHHARHRRSATDRSRVGMSEKAHDDTAVPLCMLHHKRFHDGGPPFVAMGKMGRREWMDKVAAQHRERFGWGLGIEY